MFTSPGPEPAGCGGKVLDHERPFQCIAWLRSLPPVKALMPTAKHEVGAPQPRPKSSSPCDVSPLLGSGTRCRTHEWPAQVSASLKVLAGPVEYDPTARHRMAEGHRTLPRLLLELLVRAPGSGTPCRDHDLPFQCRTSFSSGELSFPEKPVAQQLRAEMQVTSVSSFVAVWPVPAGWGVRIANHARPFQWSIWFSFAPRAR